MVGVIFSKKSMIQCFALCGLVLYFGGALAVEVPIKRFEIKPYSQQVNDYIPENTADYVASLLNPDYQTLQLQQLYNHYYSTEPNGLSPWSQTMVEAVLPYVKRIETRLLSEFNNQHQSETKRHYAENFRPHDEDWFNPLKINMDLDALASQPYQEKNKAIAVANTLARALPDTAPDFFAFTLPGQGFPFDNLQQSVIWAGTPLYVLGVTKDKSWSLVYTPDGYFAWVKSGDVAHVSKKFIRQWQIAAQKGLVAIIKTGASILDKQGHFLVTGYIGSVFPIARQGKSTSTILVPAKNQEQQAIIVEGIVQQGASSIMPVVASKKNIVNILQQLHNRPYGWGGAFFFNDCSQEMKSLFTPLGIWLPRHSAQQASLGIPLDLSKKGVDERLTVLKTQGHPLMTLIYVGGHIMLYVGNQKKSDHSEDAITYQNVWALEPASKDKRYVIGRSLFLPLLRHYPDNPEVHSQADKVFFKMVYLDELNNKAESPQAFARRILNIDTLDEQ